MKKTFVIILGILTFFAFSSAFVKVEAADPTYTITVISYFDASNQTTNTLTEKAYASKLSLDTQLGSLTNYSFDFWVVNDVVRRDLDLTHQFVVTGNMEITGVFSRDTESAVLFMDSNGKLIETVYTATSTVSPTVNVDSYTKPNYIVDTLNRWDKPLNNITESDTRVLQYKIDTESEFSLNVVEGTVLTTPNGTDGKFKYNTPVTVEANAAAVGEKFSHWQINGQAVSNDTTYSVSIIEKTTITAVYVLEATTLTSSPLVAIRDVALRTGFKSYVAQMYIPEGHTLIDYGFLRSTDTVVDLIFDDSYRVKSDKYFGQTKEYLGSFNSDIKSIKAYLVTEHNSALYYSFSNQINYGFSAGAGTLESPYEVNTVYDLELINNNLSAYYVLNADLDLTDYNYGGDQQGWTPIGIDSSTSFTGSFDGQGHYIRGLYINRPERDNVGLFGHIGVSLTSGTTTVKNVILVDVDITGNRGTGSLVGRVTGNAQTLIEYSGVVNGTVRGTGATGGLVGSNNSFAETGAADRNPVLRNSFSVNVNVYGEDRDERTYEKFGGLVGCSQKGTVSNSYAINSVSVDDSQKAVLRVGGLIGCNILRGFLSGSYSASIVASPNTGSTAFGSLIGKTDNDSGNYSPIENAYWNSSLNSVPGIGEGSIKSGEIAVGLATESMQGTSAQTNMSAFNWTTTWQTSTNYPVLSGTQRFVDFQLFAQGLLEFNQISS